jgi:hypothetical protein
MSVRPALQAKRAPAPIRPTLKAGLKVPKTCSPKIIALITKNRQNVASFFRRARKGFSWAAKPSGTGSPGPILDIRDSILGWSLKWTYDKSPMRVINIIVLTKMIQWRQSD